MSLTSGTRLGPYEVHSRIGSGGMGEVYRARDARLDRDVAIKVLPESFSTDPERLARFEREAKTVASLNHPHIAQVYGVEDATGVRALVMELVDGPTLADVIAHGPVAISDALNIARQIADALEAAHERGIVHRDLKPANIKVRNDGTVKVLDFGLAKALDPASSGRVDAMNSPTFTAATQVGVILGTAAYMAPEQAKGKAVDRRADVWAFGCVLYEMLAGRPAFDGETVTDVLAAIVTREPDWAALPAGTPSSLLRLLRRCLDRDVRRRLGDLGEARFQIDETLTSQPAVAPTATAPFRGTTRARWRAAIPWTIAAIAGVLAAASWMRGGSPAPAPIVRFIVPAVSGTVLHIGTLPAVAVSRDGNTLAFTGGTGGVTRIYVRRHDEYDARPLASTDDASGAVFSPDGQWLAFFADDTLKKVALAGGAPVTLASVLDPRGLSWDTDDVITYAPRTTGGVFQVAATGGEPKVVSTLDAKKHERTHRWPQALPGGKAVIFTVGGLATPDSYEDATIEAHVLATGERKVLITGASMARYVRSGHLLFARGGILHAIAFDPERLAVTGSAVPVVRGVAGDITTGASHFACGASGALVYVPGTLKRLHNVVWVDRTGKVEPVDIPPGPYYDPALSPDGGRLALVQVGTDSDIWVYDFASKTFTRLSFEGTNYSPAWSRDGTTLYFVKNTPATLLKKPADGSREAEVVQNLEALIAAVEDIRPDGSALVVDVGTSNSTAGMGHKTDIFSVPLHGASKPQPLVATPFDEYAGALSPDGRLLAYQSNENGQYEVFVRDVTGTGGRWQISSRGGEEPRWSPDGRELFYRSGARFMRVAVATTPTFRAGTPQLLFEGAYNLRSTTGISYRVHPSGNRFLMLRPAGDTLDTNVVHVALNWFDELRRVVPSPFR